MTHNDSQVEALKPCPFCGGEAEIIGRSVHCNSPVCEAQPFTAGQSESEAIAAWNRRTALSALAAGKVEARAATRAEVLSDVDPVVLEVWKLQGRKVGAMLREAQAAIIELQEQIEDSPSPLSADPESAVVGAATVTREQALAALERACDGIKDVQVRMAIRDEFESALAPTLPHPALDRANAGERESEAGRLFVLTDGVGFVIVPDGVKGPDHG